MIAGPAGGVTVSGGGQSRVFQVDNLVTASISGMTITGGNVDDDGLYNGGGLYNDGGNVTLTNCTIRGNSAGDGGGVFNGGTATLANCTVSGNSASNGLACGGGLYNGGTATLTNCTVSGNSADLFGSGVYDPGTATLTNCTVSGNTGGGLFDYLGGGTATLTNTIVAGNQGEDLDGALTAASTHNLIGGDPLLAPLGNYGGPTQTMALLPGSPAIDAEAPADRTSPANDQPRPEPGRPP